MPLRVKCFLLSVLPALDRQAFSSAEAGEAPQQKAAKHAPQENRNEALPLHPTIVDPAIEEEKYAESCLRKA